MSLNKSNKKSTIFQVQPIFQTQPTSLAKNHQLSTQDGQKDPRRPRYLPVPIHTPNLTRFTNHTSENNPTVMSTLATKLGVSPTLTFHDIYSLDPSDLAHIPKPVVALLAVVPD